MTQSVVLITGCTEGGIGYGLCEEFVKQRCRVYATARRVESMGALQGCELLALDVTNAASIESTVQKVIDEAGHIDILINNAGAPGVDPLLDIDMDDARQCFEVNVFGLLSMCRAVARHMAKRGSGKIANVGSIVGYASTPWAGVYAASKAAVHSLTDTLRMELSPFGIQVTVVAPGSIKSNFGKNATNMVSVPEDSFYLSVVKYIYARANMSQGPHSTPTSVFAAHVANKLLKRSSPRYVTYGTNSWTFLLFYYLPVFVKEYILGKRLGIREVKPIANKDN
ncbi:hypothetical protein BDB00DRAFT_843952 [Zychaea mexicana]|uniref:uncharacterized protein n=1 Tax=Zychaea mexicana TaxID=64656 RepID=UPI0022FDC71F|nr:uncharacterized protein BDB00DRAFT_843952 [Zychaea mexicana]KAI9489335.1 hypothetical protein BDB00DRAFT_843952 [Zychaea mexicana]